MSDIQILPINASFMAVTSEDEGIREDLYQYFRFEEPTFTPNKFSKWDGSVRLYDKRSGKISYGLLSTVIAFAHDRQLTIDIDPAFKQDIKPITEEQINEWCDTLDLRDGDNKISPYDYQRAGLYLAIKYSRVTLLAATSAGKSLLQYLIIRFHQQLNTGRILLIVPSINLVTQMYGDFKNYSTANGWDADKNCHMVYDGRTPYTNKPVVISTWQSLKDLEPDYFQQFSVMLGDECHTFSGECLEKIGKNCTNAYSRVGLTGTLKKDKLHPLQVQQHFGPIRRIVTTKQLQDAGRAAKTQVHIIQLEHTTDDRKNLDGEYQKEIEFLIGHPYRNKIIKGLAKTLKGNTLILFDRIDAHLKIVAKELQDEMPHKRVLIITGEVENDERNVIKAEMEVGEDIVLLASFGTVSTGVSIKRLHNLVFAHPSKSVIRILQSLGRLLRLHSSKDVANIYDIVDVMMYYGKINHAMRHGAERLGFYTEEQHPVTVRKLHVPDPNATTVSLVG
jgi:superfamily II DNA or RNA helicase